MKFFATVFPLAFLATLATASSSHSGSASSHHKKAVAELKRSELTTDSTKVVQSFVDPDDEDLDEADLLALEEVDDDDLEDATYEDDEEDERNIDKRALQKRGKIPGGFGGVQKGIGSWFRANNGGDSTNGKSWCGLAYKDNMPLFAPKFGVMSPSHATWGSNPKKWIADGKKWCGLEAKVWYTDKKGHKRTKYMYIGDAFDDAWVRSKGSIDILKGAFASLYGKSTSTKSVVMQNVQWKLTGKRSKKYSFKG